MIAPNDTLRNRTCWRSLPALPGRWCPPRAGFPKGYRRQRPHTLHRIALLWSNLSGVSGGTSSIQRQSAGRPDAGDMGLSTERQCNLRRTRIKPIRTMSL